MKSEVAWKWMALAVIVMSCCGFPCFLGNKDMLLARGCRQQQVIEVIDCMGAMEVLIEQPETDARFAKVEALRPELGRFTGTLSIHFEYSVTLCSARLVLECQDGKVLRREIVKLGCT